MEGSGPALSSKVLGGAGRRRRAAGDDFTLFFETDDGEPVTGSPFAADVDSEAELVLSFNVQTHSQMMPGPGDHQGGPDRLRDPSPPTDDLAEISFR